MYDYQLNSITSQKTKILGISNVQTLSFKYSFFLQLHKPNSITIQYIL